MQSGSTTRLLTCRKLEALPAVRLAYRTTMKMLDIGEEIFAKASGRNVTPSHLVECTCGQM